jgi:hypothetical protein
MALVFVFYNLAAQPGFKFPGLNLARLYNNRGQQTQIQNQFFKEKMTIDTTIETPITICNQPIFTGIKHHIIEKVLVEATNNYPYGTEKKLINAGQVFTNIAKLTNINSSDIFADTECLKSLKRKLELYTKYITPYDTEYINPDIPYSLLEYLTTTEYSFSVSRKNGFREAVSKLAGGRCIISGRYGIRCEAAHIWDFALCQSDMECNDPENGIFLAKELHGLWDKDFIISVPVSDTEIEFRINTELVRITYPDTEPEEFIPELAQPVVIGCLSDAKMDYFRRRCEYRGY